MNGTSSPERWLPIPGAGGSYEVSDHGNVRSVDRRVSLPDGRTRFARGRVLKAAALPSGHRHVVVNGKSQLVHRLVAVTFIGAAPFSGAEVRHLDGNPDNNSLANLKWGSRSENSHDSISHGTHNQARKTHCIRGHALSLDNVLIRKDGGRQCRKCARIRNAEWARRKREKLR